MIYDLQLVRARSAVRVAKAELRRWERRYDRDQSGDPLRFVAELRAAETRYKEAVEALRLVRDGQPHLPEAAHASSAPRAPTFRAR